MEMDSEVVRLQAAISLIHNHLHAGEINKAHAACECALEGGQVSQPNLTTSQSASSNRLAYTLNDEIMKTGLSVAYVMFLPSATKKGYTSIQLGGEVEAAKHLERMLGKRSLYRGDHRR